MGCTPSMPEGSGHQSTQQIVAENSLHSGGSPQGSPHSGLDSGRFSEAGGFTSLKHLDDDHGVVEQADDILQLSGLEECGSPVKCAARAVNAMNKAWNGTSGQGAVSPVPKASHTQGASFRSSATKPDRTSPSKAAWGDERPSVRGGKSLAARYSGGPPTLSLSTDTDDSDSEGQAGFDLDRWKRFWHWNRRKPEVVQKFLWKRWQRGDGGHSIWLISYKLSSCLYAPYQGENIIHGMHARVMQFISTGPLFGVLNSYVHKDKFDEHMVLGVFIAQGTGALPPCLAKLPELDNDWVVILADPLDPEVRSLVNTCLSGQAPQAAKPGFIVLASREIV